MRSFEQLAGSDIMKCKNMVRNRINFRKKVKGGLQVPYTSKRTGGWFGPVGVFTEVVWPWVPPGGVVKMRKSRLNDGSKY